MYDPRQRLAAVARAVPLRPRLARALPRRAARARRAHRRDREEALASPTQSAPRGSRKARRQARATRRRGATARQRAVHATYIVDLPHARRPGLPRPRRSIPTTGRWARCSRSPIRSTRTTAASASARTMTRARLALDLVGPLVAREARGHDAAREGAVPDPAPDRRHRDPPAQAREIRDLRGAPTSPTTS